MLSLFAHRSAVVALRQAPIYARPMVAAFSIRLDAEIETAEDTLKVIALFYGI